MASDAANYESGLIVPTPARTGVQAPEGTVLKAQKAAMAQKTISKKTDVQRTAAQRAIKAKPKDTASTARWADDATDMSEAEEDPDTTPPRKGERPNEVQKEAERLDADEDELLDKPAPMSQDDDLEPQEPGAPYEIVQAARQNKMVKGWMRVSRPPSAAGMIEATAIVDAILLAIMDLSDEERPGGAWPNLPTKLIASDSGRADGPWWFAVRSPAELKAFLAANGPLLAVEAAGDTTVACKIAADTNTKDIQAHTLGDIEGFWMEVFVSKKGELASTDRAADLVRTQLNVMVISAKWPRPLKGCPPNKTKVCIKAIPHAGSRVSRPVTLKLRGGSLTVPLRYRVQQGFLKDACDKCHQTESGCLCEAAKIKNDAGKERRLNFQSERRDTIARKATAGGSSSSNTGTNKTIAQKMSERRDRNIMIQNASDL